MKRTIASMFLLALVACAGPGTGAGYWDHAHHDPALFQRDAAQCTYEAAAARPGSTGGAGLGVSISQDIAAGFQRAELEGMCMRAKGYVYILRR